MIIPSMWYSVVQCGIVWYSVVQCYLVSCWLVLGGGCWRLLVVWGSLGDSRAPQSSPLLSVRGQRQAASASTTYQQSSSQPQSHGATTSTRPAFTELQHSMRSLAQNYQVFHSGESLVQSAGAVSPLSPLLSTLWRHQDHHNDSSLGSRQT